MRSLIPKPSKIFRQSPAVDDDGDFESTAGVTARSRADLYDQASRVLLYHWDVDQQAATVVNGCNRAAGKAGHATVFV